MSYILDALRKSQQVRQSIPMPEPRGAVDNISLSLLGIGWWLAAGMLLLLGISFAAIIFWRGTVGGALVTPAETAPPAASVGKPASVAREMTRSPEKPQQLAKPAKRMIPVHDLAEEAQLPIHIVPKTTVPVHDSGKEEVTQHSTVAVSIPAAPVVPDDAPLLQQMPTDFQRALPPLRVSIHVYAPDPSQRILFVNNRQYHQGDRIYGDISVEDIVPDGVILSYRGERFKLGRPR